MTLFHLFLVALVQGITEFLPISSSAHLILAPKVLGTVDQGPIIDVAVHVGTLFAVIIAFWKDVQGALAGFLRLLAGRLDTWEARLALYLILGTIPVVLVGLLIHQTVGMDALRSIEIIGWTTLIFGIALYIADQFAPTTKAIERDLTLSGAMILGLAQAISLAPGTSRSGITMTAGRALGFSRTDAARYSMLMAIPTIIAAGALATKDVLDTGNFALGLDALSAAALSFVAALIAIKLFMRYMKSATMTPFVVYRMILGAVLLWIAYA